MSTYLDRGVRLLAVLMLVCAPLLVLAQEDEPQPDIFIAELRHDFGEVFEQDKFTHAFKVENKGTADLEIKSVRPG